MRNLKRALSLALASVMLMGMMVVGSSAASFPDVDTDKHNIEAIDILETVQVMIGNENGDFEPDKPVTRAEMAVVMAKLLDLDYKYYETSCPFNDVPAWAAGYVGACAANGIVSGRGDGVYDPNATVTAVEASSMMMRALGYFQNAGDYEGGFEAATVKQASRISLFDGIDGNARDPMDRNQVAQLALNTLEANMVEFTGSMGIEIPGVGNVGYDSKYEYRTGTEAKYRAISSLGTTNVGDVAQSYVQLGEQLYSGDLKKFPGEENGFGMPATRWTYKNTEVGTYADGEDCVFQGEVKSSDMYAAVGKTAAENYEWIVKMDGRNVDAEGNALFVRKDVSDNDKDTLAGTKRGSATYVFLSNNAHGNYSGTATVCIVNTYAAEVSKVSNGKITLDDMAGKRLEVEAEGYGEDDVVLYTKSISGTTWTVEEILGKAELVEGKADTIRNADRVVIGDTTYRYSYRYFDGDDKYTVDSVDKSVAFYMDTQDNIIKKSDAEESNDYAYVLDIGKADSKYGEAAEYGAQLILTDGKKIRVDISTDTTEKWTDLVASEDDKLKVLQSGATSNDTGANWSESSASPVSVTGEVLTGTNQKKAPLKGQVVSYTEDGGLYELTVKTTHEANWDGKSSAALEGVIKNDNSRVNMSNAAATPTASYVYMDKNSAILLDTDSSNTDVDFEPYTGYETVPNVNVAATSKLVAYVDGVVKAMFITDADIGGSGDVIFVIGADSPKLEGTGSNKYYNYDAVVNGEIQTLRVKEGSDAATTLTSVTKNKLGVYFGITENNNGYVTKLTTKSPTDVEVNGIKNNTGTNTTGVYSTIYTGVNSPSSSGLLGFEWNSTDEKFDVRPAANEDATIVYYDGDDLDTETSLHRDYTAKAWVVTDEGKVVAVFVWEQKDDSVEEEELPEYDISELNGTLNITSVNNLTVNQIKSIIAEHFGVDVDDVSYNRAAQTATVGRDTYKVTVGKVGTEEEVAGAKLINEIQNKIGTTSATGAAVTIEGNTITTTPSGGATGSTNYVDPAKGENKTSQATLDLVKFLVELKGNGATEIEFDDVTYEWNTGIRFASKWLKVGASVGTSTSGEPDDPEDTLARAIEKSFTAQIKTITDGSTNGTFSVSATIIVDGAEMNIAINYTKG